MVRWPASYFGIDPAEPELSQIGFIDEDVDETIWIVLADPVFHGVRKQCVLPTIRPPMKRFIRDPHKSRGNHTARITPLAAFLHSHGNKQTFRPPYSASALHLDAGIKVATSKICDAVSGPQLC